MTTTIQNLDDLQDRRIMMDRDVPPYGYAFVTVSYTHLDVYKRQVHVALGAGDALGDGLHGGVIQGLDLARVLLHHGLDLGVGVTGRLISRSAPSLTAT